MPHPVESTGYIKCYNSSSPRPIKSHSNSIDATVTRYAVDREDLKPYWKSGMRPQFLGDQQDYYLPATQKLY